MNSDRNLVTVSESESILDTLKAINVGATRFAMVVDNDNRLVGVVTDGDVRRGILMGHEMSEPINKIMNRSPVLVDENLDREAMLELIDEKYSQIPVVDANRRIKGIISYRDKSLLVDARSRNVCVLGLGYVGLTLSLSLSEAGFYVYGYDIDQNLVKKIQSGYSPFFEEGVDSHLNRYLNKRFLPVTNLTDTEVDTYVVAVGTPVNLETKSPNIGYIENVVETIGKMLKPGDLVVLRSTVPVGTTRNVVTPLLSKMSKLKIGKEFFVAYAPERTIEGRAITELKELPQIIGGHDKKSTMLVNRLFQEVTPTILDVGSLEGAEMVKILNNTFRDVKFAYANEMAQIGKELGLDTVKLIRAANLGYVRDTIPVPSPGVGGACLTKDPYLLIDSCRTIEKQPSLVKLSREINEAMPKKIATEVQERLRQLNKETSSAKIFIIGFAFKGEPETSDVRGSTSIDLLKYFQAEPISCNSIFGYDPIVPENELMNFGITPTTLENGFLNADVVMIMNNHSSYQKIDIFDMLNTAKDNCIFVDGWYTFEPTVINTINNIQYIGIGCAG